MELLFVSGRKSISKIWTILPRSHCNLLHHINSCYPIDNIMEFIWNLLNSDTFVFNRIVKHSLGMSSTTLGENNIYLKFKYYIYIYIMTNIVFDTQIMCLFCYSVILKF